MAANPFDQFDEQAKGNPFDVFDKEPAAQPTPEAKPEEGKKDAGIGEYLWNQFKLGTTNTAALVDLAARQFGRIFSEKEIAQTLAPFAYQEQAAAPEVVAVQQKPGATKSDFDQFMKQYQQSQQRFAGLTGAQPEMRAPGPVSKIVGAGVQNLADPINYLGGLGLVKTPVRMAGEFLTGATADIGSDVGAAAERVLTGQESGAGRLIGGIGAAVGTGAPRQAALDTIENATSQIRRNRQILKESPTGAQQMFASGAAKNLLSAAAQAQGVQSVDDLLKLVNEASQFVNKSNSPLVIAMADNPVIRQQVQRLAKTNPEFGQKVNDLLFQANADIEGKVTRMFGERYAAGEISPKAGLKVKNIKRRADEIAKDLSDVADRVTPAMTKEDIGSRIESLVEERKKAARAEVSPEYESLLGEARASNVKMPEEGVGQIYDFVVQNNMRDIFGKTSQIDKDIMRHLEPIEVTRPNPQTGLPETVREHTPMSFDNVESLKKAINRIKRDRLSDEQARKINQLEQVVDQARETIPGDFSKRLNDVDLKYYEKVGVPFGEQGIKDIDSKKYATQVAPVIVNNPESYDQFIRAVGPEKGNVLAENAIISEVYDKAVKDGMLNPGQLEKYLKNKAGVIRKIPGLEEKLRGALIDDSQLRARLDSINDAAKVAERRVANNALTSISDVPNYTTLASDVINNPADRRKILKSISDLDADTAKAVRNTLRAEVINIARNNPQGFLSYITSAKNKAGVEAIFGPAFQSSLKKIARFSDKVGSADISNLGVALRREDYDALARLIPGVSIPYFMSTWRDRISSGPHKVIRIFSKYNSANLVKATDKAIEELLLDPNGVQKLANTITDVKFKLDNPVSMKKLQESLSRSVPRAYYSGFKTSLESEKQQQMQGEANQERAADFVVGGFEGPEVPQMARGGVVDDGTDYTQYNARIFRALVAKYGSEEAAREAFRSLDGGELVRIMESYERGAKRAHGGVVYTPDEQRLLMRYATR